MTIFKQINLPKTNLTPVVINVENLTNQQMNYYLGLIKGVRVQARNDPDTKTTHGVQRSTNYWKLNTWDEISNISLYHGDTSFSLGLMLEYKINLSNSGEKDALWTAGVFREDTNTAEVTWVESSSADPMNAVLKTALKLHFGETVTNL